jgi:hypothetical protein
VEARVAEKESRPFLKDASGSSNKATVIAYFTVGAGEMKHESSLHYLQHSPHVSNMTSGSLLYTFLEL